MKGKKALALLAVLACVVAGFGGIARPMVSAAVSAGAEQNEWVQSTSIDYTVKSLTQDTALDTSVSPYQISASGHKVGNFGGYDGYKFICAEGEGKGSIEYGYTGGGEPLSAQFYTMLNNMSKGVLKAVFTVKKLTDDYVLDFGIRYFDVVAKKDIGKTDLTAEYNAATAGERFDIVKFIDLSFMGSVDSQIIWVKSALPARFRIEKIEYSWGDTAIATADGTFIGLERGFPVLFDKMAEPNTSRVFAGFPLNGYAADNGAGFDSGSFPDWGFNHGVAKANNTVDGEYLSFEAGADASDTVQGLWVKFPLDTDREQKELKVRFTVAKTGEANPNELKFELIAAAEQGTNVPIIIDDTDFASMTAGEWTTFERTVDYSGIAVFDSLGIWGNCAAASAILLKNVSFYYDDYGPERSKALTEEESSVNGLNFVSPDGVSVKSDAQGRQYMDLDFTAAGGSVEGVYPSKAISKGKFQTVVSVQKTAALPADFTFTATLNNGAASVATTDFSAKIKAAEVGKWISLAGDSFDLDTAADGFTVKASSSAGTLRLESVAVRCVAKFVAADLSFGVKSELVRNFEALNGLGTDEYDFSQNTFPEVGNWSNSFSDLRAQGQKAVRDTDGTPVMKIYRRTPAEIAQAKVEYEWPDTVEYVPADKSHFFVTAPLSAGYFDLTAVFKKGGNFKDSDEFSFEGYMGSDPWYKLANITDELKKAEKGEWVTVTKSVYIPASIDSIKICIETRFEDSDLFIKSVTASKKQGTADASFDASKAADVSFMLITDGVSLVNSVKLDGAEVSAASYVSEAGRFTLKSDYLKTLSNGSFTFALSNGKDEIRVNVLISKIAPVIRTASLYVKQGSKSDTVLDVDLKNSGVVSVMIGERELEVDTDYSVDSENGHITFSPSAFSDLGEGRHKLTLTTRAGSAEFEFTVAKSNAWVWIIVGIGAALVVGAAATVTVLAVRKKKKTAKGE